MTERRFFVTPDDPDTRMLRLERSEAHHARAVLRLAPGASVFCFDGRGGAWLGTITHFGRDHALVSVSEKLTAEPPPRPRVTLALGLLKGDRMDAAIQKATELGVSEIVPLRADRCEVRLGAERSDKRLVRWEKISLEASKQSERRWLPHIAFATTVEQFLGARTGLAIAFVERTSDRAQSVLARAGTVDAVSVLVGCEGGWSERESPSSMSCACRARRSVRESSGPIPPRWRP